MSRFVRPETLRIPISDGDWIVVKKRLTAGETRGIYKRMLVLADGAHVPHMDPVQTGLSKIVAYLVDWSLTDEGGKVVPIVDQPEAAVTSALNALDPDSFTEILAAVEKHEDTMEQERAAEKNSKGGGSKSSVTLPSVATSTGAIATS